MIKFKQADDQIIRDRQQWFWRRLTLQLTLTSIILILANSIFSIPPEAYTFKHLYLHLGLCAAAVFLVTIYFAAVNDAAKISKFVGAVGNAIGDAKGNDSDKPESPPNNS